MLSHWTGGETKFGIPAGLQLLIWHVLNLQNEFWHFIVLFVNGSHIAPVFKTPARCCACWLAMVIWQVWAGNSLEKPRQWVVVHRDLRRIVNQLSVIQMLLYKPHQVVFYLLILTSHLLYFCFLLINSLCVKCPLNYAWFLLLISFSSLSINFLEVKSFSYSSLVSSTFHAMEISLWHHKGPTYTFCSFVLLGRQKFWRAFLNFMSQPAFVALRHHSDVHM